MALLKRKKLIFACSLMLITSMLMGVFFFYTSAESEEPLNKGYDHVVRDSVMFDKFETDNNEEEKTDSPTPYAANRHVYDGWGTTVRMQGSTLVLKNNSVYDLARSAPGVAAYAKCEYTYKEITSMDLTGCDTFSFKYNFGGNKPDNGVLRIVFACRNAVSSEDGWFVHIPASSLNDSGTYTVPMSSFLRSFGTDSWANIYDLCIKWCSSSYGQPFNTSLRNIEWRFDQFYFYRAHYDLPLIESFDSGKTRLNIDGDPNDHGQYHDDQKFRCYRKSSCNVYSDNVMQGTGSLVYDSDDCSFIHDGDLGTGPIMYINFDEVKDLSNCNFFDLEVMVTASSNRNSKALLDAGYLQINFIDSNNSFSGNGFDFMCYFTDDGTSGGREITKGQWNTFHLEKGQSTMSIAGNPNWNHITSVRIAFIYKNTSVRPKDGINLRFDDLRGDNVASPKLTDYVNQGTYDVIPHNCSVSRINGSDDSQARYEGQEASLKMQCTPSGNSSYFNQKLATTKNISKFDNGSGYIRVPVFCRGNIPNGKFILHLTTRRSHGKGFRSELPASQLVKDSWCYLYFKMPSESSTSTVNFYSQIRQLRFEYNGSSNCIFYLGDIIPVDKTNTETDPTILDSMSNITTRVTMRGDNTDRIDPEAKAPAYGSFVPGKDDGGKSLGVFSKKNVQISRIGPKHYLCCSAYFYFVEPKNTRPYTTIEIDLYSSIDLPQGTVEFNLINVDHPAYFNGYDFKVSNTAIKKGWNHVRLFKYPNNLESIYCTEYKRADFSRVFQICFSYYQINDNDPETVSSCGVDFYIDTVYQSNYNYFQNEEVKKVIKDIDDFNYDIKNTVIDFTDKSPTSQYQKFLDRYDEINNEISVVNDKWNYYDEDLTKEKYFKYHAQPDLSEGGYSLVYPPIKSNDGYTYLFAELCPDEQKLLEDSLKQLDKARAITPKPSVWRLGKHYNSSEITSSTVIKLTNQSSVSALFSFVVNYSGTFEDKLMPYISLTKSDGSTVSIPKGTSIILRDATVETDGSLVYYYIAEQTVTDWIPFSSMIKTSNSSLDKSQRFCSEEGISFPASGTETKYIVIFDFSNCETPLSFGNSAFASFKLCDNTYNKNNTFSNSFDKYEVTSERQFNISTSLSGNYHQSDVITSNTSVSIGKAEGDSYNLDKCYNIVYYIKKDGNIINIPYGTKFKFDDSNCTVRENRYIFAYSSPSSPLVFENTFNGRLEIDFSDAITELKSGEYILCSDLYVSYDNTHPFGGKIVGSSSGSFNIIKNDKFSAYLSDDQRILYRTDTSKKLLFNLDSYLIDGRVTLEVQEKVNGNYVTKDFNTFVSSYSPDCRSADSTSKLFVFNNSIPSNFELTFNNSICSQYTYRFLFKLYNVENTLVASVPINVVFSYDGMLYAESSQGGNVSIDW